VLDADFLGQNYSGQNALQWNPATRHRRPCPEQAPRLSTSSTWDSVSTSLKGQRQLFEYNRRRS